MPSSLLVSTATSRTTLFILVQYSTTLLSFTKYIKCCQSSIFPAIKPQWFWIHTAVSFWQLCVCECVKSYLKKTKTKTILNPSRFISLSFKFFKDMLSHIFSGSLFSGSAFFPEVEGYLWADGAHRCFLISTSYRAKGTRSCCICSCISSIATASQ